ncbi:MAG: hypothetical protein LBQ54_12210 [Planctomycetaceae bacterium]|nr:hypothetical protein [Planctomycetaceae bacterium]
MQELTKEELTRYSRHLILPEVGKTGITAMLKNRKNRRVEEAEMATYLPKYGTALYRISIKGSIILFLLSLIQPAFIVKSGGMPFGFFLLLFGWLGALMGGVGISWLANPLILVSWVTAGVPRLSFVLSLLAVLFAASFLMFDEIIINEGGGMGKIIGYYSGYWFWLFSMLVMLAGNTIRLILLSLTSPVQKQQADAQKMDDLM